MQKESRSWRKRVAFVSPPLSLPLFSEGSPRSPLKRHGSIFFFFSSTKWQPCCRQAAWQSSGCVCASAEGTGEPPRPPSFFLVPAPLTPGVARRAPVRRGSGSRLSRLNGDLPCGLKSKGSCHRNAQVCPPLSLPSFVACVAHLTR